MQIEKCSGQIPPKIARIKKLFPCLVHLFDAVAHIRVNYAFI